MNNLHTPQRLQGENQTEYRARRAASKLATEKMTLTGAFTPGKNTGREELRDQQRKSGAMKGLAGSYGRGLRNWINRTQAAQQAQRLAKQS